MSQSANEHGYREIFVRIWPYETRATVSVHLRRKRGTDVVWDRRLGVVGVELPPGTDTNDLASVVELCGQQLLEIAQRARK